VAQNNVLTYEGVTCADPAYRFAAVTLADGRIVAFEDAPLDQLANDPKHWVLREGEAWHGFKVYSAPGPGTVCCNWVFDAFWKALGGGCLQYTKFISCRDVLASGMCGTNV
jgi:hypothetical protein